MLEKLKKHLPTAKELEQYRYLRMFGSNFKQAELWRFTRQTTSKGIAIGIFCAFLPMPFEMIPAIFLAIYLRGNMPFAVAGVWISNPFTWVPLYTPCYLLGAYLINVEPINLHQITILQFGWHYVALWLGCLIVGLFVALSTHFIISFTWRSQIQQRWERRQKRRRAKKNQGL